MASIATMTGVHFDALSYEEGRRWELLEGELVEVSSPTPEQQILVQRILFALVLYGQSRRRVLVLTDVEFALAADIRVRPDVAFCSGSGLNIWINPRSPSKAVRRLQSKLSRRVNALMTARL